MNKFSFFKKVNSNKLLFGMIPNLITSVRIIMTLYIIWMLGSNKHNISIFLSINSLIFISDIIDGRIARYLKSVSSFGEILDISADFLYILSMSIIMNIKNIIPRNYIVIVIIEFTIFIITSKYIKQDKRYLGFDILGRILAVLFYIIPVMMFLFL